LGGPSEVIRGCGVAGSEAIRAYPKCRVQSAGRGVVRTWVTLQVQDTGNTCLPMFIIAAGVGLARPEFASEVVVQGKHRSGVEC
jgi:hypothetical protein